MGGGRLGGSEELAKLPPREAAAAAAERRAQAASFAKRHLLLDDVSEESAPDLVGAGGPSVRAPSVTFTLGAPAAGRAGVGASDARHEESSGAQMAAIAGTCPHRRRDSHAHARTHTAHTRTQARTHTRTHTHTQARTHADGCE